MFDFAALPPETNSTRMYLGVGSGPIVAAAAAWTGLAKELSAAARGLQSVLETLLLSFRGESSEALTERVLPYVGWLSLTAAGADETAGQLTAVASAYDTARSGTVPPTVVLVNRMQTAMLKALNWFGQFSSMIADQEADYELMWTQNAMAMTAYQSQVLDVIGKTLPFEAAPEMVSEEGLVQETLIREGLEEGLVQETLIREGLEEGLVQETLIREGLEEGLAQETLIREGLEEGLAQETLIREGLEEVGELVFNRGVAGPPNVGMAQLGPRVVTPKAVFDPSSTVANSLWGGAAKHLDPMSNIVSMVNNKVGMANAGLSMVSGMGSMMKSVVPTTAANAVEALAQGGQAIENAIGSVGRGVLGSGLGGQITANLGRAMSVGSLRVPETWAVANQAVTPAMRALPLASRVATAVEGGPVPLMGGMPVGNMASGGGGVGVSSALRLPPRPFTMPRNLAG
ncbi:PPE family protein, partial [Mycobacterium uberis]